MRIRTRARIVQRADSTQSTAVPPRLQIDYKDIGDLKPYRNNPRDNDAAVKSVANSISSFGFLVPIVVDSHDVIVAGHTRYTAAISIGMTEVPCVVVDNLTEDQIRAFRLIDNKVSELAKWDTTLLAGELSALRDSGIEFVDFGWGREELDCLTDMVADDCMSAGAAASLEGRSAGATPEQRRAPGQTRLVIGEIVIFVPKAAYQQWVTSLRVAHDYEEDSIQRALLASLGLAPYVNAASAA